MTEEQLREQLPAQAETIVHRALEEDVGRGDLTTTHILPAEMKAAGSIVAKAEGVVAGLAVAQLTFALIDAEIRFLPCRRDGDAVGSGDHLAEVSGPGRGLLTGERVALNFLQRMSGIASLTRSFVRAVAHTSAVILDTRKTAPGLRLLDKWSVRCGGGRNHRRGLDDACLIKENHIRAAGGITEALRRIRDDGAGRCWVEIEVRNLDELREAAALPCDRILLDNMTVHQLRQAVQAVSGRIPLEASGNIGLDNVAEIAETGVDFISVGALTHSVRALDISFLLSRINNDL